MVSIRCSLVSFFPHGFAWLCLACAMLLAGALGLVYTH